MSRPKSRADSSPQHPLLADRPRLDRILKNMDITIQRVLYGHHAASEAEERVVHGGASSRDVLQQALLELLAKDSVSGSWEGLSQTIAKRRAIDAVRHATAGRRAPDADDDDPDDINVVPFDATEEHTLPAASASEDPERRFLINEQLRVLHKIVRALADPLAQTIFNEIHFRCRSRVVVGAEVGLTPQRVGQIYRQTLLQVWRQAQQDPEFPAETLEGGHTS